MRLTRLRALPLLLLSCALHVGVAAQETLFPDETRADRWAASVSIGQSSPFASDAFSIAWNGHGTISGTLEYFPSPDAAFGLFASVAMYDHTGMTVQGEAACMLGVTREHYGGGLIARIYAVRWAGVALTLAGTVGALNVTRERPVLRHDGSVIRITRLSPSLDLAFGGTFGLETTLLPGASAALEAGWEATDNQVTLDEAIVARASLRLGL